jgi:hypothetical protein
MSDQEAARVLQTRYGDIVSAFQDALKQMGLGQVLVRAVDFDIPTQKLETSPCKPGEIPIEVCEALPGGGVRCYRRCVRSYSQVHTENLEIR